MTTIIPIITSIIDIYPISWSISFLKIRRANIIENIIISPFAKRAASDALVFCNPKKYIAGAMAAPNIATVNINTQSFLFILGVLKEAVKRKEVESLLEGNQEVKDLLFSFDMKINTYPDTKYTSEDRNNEPIVDTTGFAIVETEPKNTADRIAVR